MTPPENTERGTDPHGKGTASTGTSSAQWQRGAQDGVEGAEGTTAYLPKFGNQRPGGDESGEDRRSHTGELPAIGGSATERMFGHFESDHSHHPEPGERDHNSMAKGRDNVSGASSATRVRTTPGALRRPGRGPRRASLQIKRFDPWSVLKLSLVLGVAMFFVWLVAVGLLYSVMDGMGVWDKLNGTYSSLVSGEGADSPTDPLISAGRVFGVAAILGMINIVLLSALATVCAFIYNVSADLAGGLEVTLAERD